MSNLLQTLLGNGKVKLNDGQIKRALTATSSSSSYTVLDIEELERGQLITINRETPALDMLRRTARKTPSEIFEWNDKTTLAAASLHNGLFDGFTVPSDYAGTSTRRSNRTMPLGVVAKVSNYSNSFETIDGDTMNTEMIEKTIDLTRVMEYFIWNGDSSLTGSVITESNGIIASCTTTVDNGSVPLTESTIQNTLRAVSAAGGRTSHLFGTYTAAYRIANMAEDRIRYLSAREATNGIGQNSLLYMTPFGTQVQVVPVLSDYISTGNVYALDMTQLSLRYSGNGLMSSNPISLTSDGQAVILKSYMGMEIKAATVWHRKINNVFDSQG